MKAFGSSRSEPRYTPKDGIVNRTHQKEAGIR
jgi:hypothetical protein